MANPTAKGKNDTTYLGQAIDVTQIKVSGTPVLTSQQTAITDPTAITAVAITGTLTGTDAGAMTDITYNATWSAAQANEINLNCKVLQGQVNKLIVDLTSTRTKLTNALDVLEAHGLMAA